MTPGQHECERAVEELRKIFQQVDKAMMNVESLRRTDKSSQVKTIFFMLISWNNQLFLHLVSSRTAHFEFTFSHRINSTHSSICKTRMRTYW